MYLGSHTLVNNHVAAKPYIATLQQYPGDDAVTASSHITCYIATFQQYPGDDAVTALSHITCYIATFQQYPGDDAVTALSHITWPVYTYTTNTMAHPSTLCPDYGDIKVT